MTEQFKMNSIWLRNAIKHLFEYLLEQQILEIDTQSKCIIRVNWMGRSIYINLKRDPNRSLSMKPDISDLKDRIYNLIRGVVNDPETQPAYICLNINWTKYGTAINGYLRDPETQNQESEGMINMNASIDRLTLYQTSNQLIYGHSNWIHGHFNWTKDGQVNNELWSYKEEEREEGEVEEEEDSDYEEEEREEGEVEEEEEEKKDKVE